VEHAKVVQIVKLLTEGLGIRACARFTDTDPHTVLNVLEVIGEKCAAFHDRIVQNVQTGAVQLDEVWSRIGCSQKLANRQGNATERGDFYTYLGVTAREKFIVSYHTGKRTYHNTDIFVSDLAKRIPGRIQVTSDSFRPYQSIVRKYLLGRLDFATMQKLFAAPFNANGEAARRYSPATCIGVKVRVQAGAPREDRINTSFVERANLSVRHFNKRFARLGLGYSRKVSNHNYAISLFVCAYNFCKKHSTLGCSPAVGLKLATETWTIERLIEEATK